MTGIVALVSAHGSPGGTTLGVAATGAAAAVGRKRLLIDADSWGGQVAPVAGLPWSPNAAELAAQAWEELSEERVRAHCQALGPSGRVLVGPPTGPLAAAVWAAIGGPLARLVRQLGPVVVDAGRLRAGIELPPLVAAADLVVVVVGQVPGSHWATGSQVAKAAALRSALADAGVATAAVVVGDNPYLDQAELAEVLGAPVLSLIPWDPHGARTVGEAAHRGQVRSQLMRAARELVEVLDAFVEDHPRTSSTTPGAAAS